MINQLAWSVTNLFIRREEIPDEDGEIYAFGFECILATAIQIVVLAFAGLIFGCLIELTLYSLCFTRIKGYIGGWHANTHFTCIFGYTVVALMSVCICRILPNWVSLIFLLIALKLIFKLAPIQHFNNPKTKEEIIKGRKTAITAASIISIIVCAIFISPFRIYSIYGACGFFIASLSLAFPNKDQPEQ